MGGIGTDLRVSDPISLMEGTGTAPRGHGARVPGTGSGTGFQFGPSYDIVMAVEIRVLVVLLGCRVERVAQRLWSGARTRRHDITSAME